MLEGSNEEVSLIFLVSQPRAGSTMLQMVLSGHSEIHTTAEPWLMLHPVYALRMGGHSAEYNAEVSYKALEDFLGAMEDGRDTYIDSLRMMALNLYSHACKSVGAHFFLDKTPRYYYILPELIEIFPDAKFILLFRNPLAVLNSILNTWVKDDLSRLIRFKDDMLLAPQKLIEARKILGNAAIEVHYENFVSNPTSELERICNQLGISYWSNMLNYGSRKPILGRYGDKIGVSQYETPSMDRQDNWTLLGAKKHTRYLALDYLNSLGPELVTELGYDFVELNNRILDQKTNGTNFVYRRIRLFDENPGMLDSLSFSLAEHYPRKDLIGFSKSLGRILLHRKKKIWMSSDIKRDK